MVTQEERNELRQRILSHSIEYAKNFVDIIWRETKQLEERVLDPILRKAALDGLYKTDGADYDLWITAIEALQDRKDLPKSYQRKIKESSVLWVSEEKVLRKFYGL